MSKQSEKELVSIPPKDEEELDLERLVFGDLEGFEVNLKKLDNLYDISSQEEEDTDDELFDDSESGDDSGSDGNISVDDDMFFIDDKGANDGDAMDVDDPENDERNDYSSSDSDSDYAWEDSDDERIKVSLTATSKVKKLRISESEDTVRGKEYLKRLRAQFEKIYPRPEWAERLDESDNRSNSDEDTEGEKNGRVQENDTNAILSILSKTQKFTKTKQLKLISPSKISITRLKDANYQKVSKGAIQTLSFHYSHPLLITGGFDRTVRVYHIDGKINNMVTSLHLRNSPISACQFSTIGEKKNENLLFIGGRRRYMNKWDLTTGSVEKISRLYGHEKFQKSFEYFKISSKGTYIGLTGNSGWCNILDGATGQWKKGFKIEGTIIDFAFSKDESLIIVINTAGEVWEFDLNDNSKKAKDAKKVIKKWIDHGGIGITKIELGGPKDRWLAVGTNNGIVNIYDRSTFNEGNPEPFKTVENLVTSISTLKFNPDGQLLCISSRGKRDALRLVHLPSGSVYSNWPTSGTPLGRVTAVDFSPNNEMLAIGNEAGKVTLWRLNHY